MGSQAHPVKAGRPAGSESCVGCRKNGLPETGTNFSLRSVDSECEAMAIKPRNLTSVVRGPRLGLGRGQYRCAGWPGASVLPGSPSMASTQQVPQERERPCRCSPNGLARTSCEATSVRLVDGESERADSTAEAGELSPRGPRGGRRRAVYWNRRRERCRGHCHPITSHRDSIG